jgi:hypothetical protein
MNDATEFVERRKDATSVLVVMVQQIHDNVTALDSKLTDGMKTLREDAFPEGDADGHRRHHEAVIKEAEDRAKFWQTMRIKLAEWGLIGFAAWAIYSLWQSFLQGPHK